jgi:hypothetical protein
MCPQAVPVIGGTPMLRVRELSLQVPDGQRRHVNKYIDILPARQGDILCPHLLSPGRI